MQSRLSAIARSARGAIVAAHSGAPRRGFAATVSAGRPADPYVYGRERESEIEPAVFSGKPEKTKNVAVPKPATEGDEEHDQYKPKNDTGTEPLAPPKPPHASAPRLENTGVHNPAEPSLQQKRRSSAPVIENMSCAGLDGTPWPSEKDQPQQSRGVPQEDDRDYYKHHKASPLSNIKFADSRKPITDGTADLSYYGGMPDVVGWRPEQVDTAEEALLRAATIWKESAMRGDPDAPHSKVLRELRGEI